MAAVAVISDKPQFVAQTIHFLGDTRREPDLGNSKLVRDNLPKEQFISRDSLSSQQDWKASLIDVESITDLVRGKSRVSIEHTAPAAAPAAAQQAVYTVKAGGHDM